MCGVPTSGNGANERFRGVLLVFVFISRAGCLIINAQVGDTVLLPCIYRKDPPLSDTASVFWRDNNNSVVLDINKRQPNEKNQDQKYKGRVFSFPSLYEAGNFSVQMKDVEQTDTSSYECHIPNVSFQQTVSLKVSGWRAPATSPPGPAGGAVLTPPPPYMSLLPVALSLITSCVHG